MLDDSPNTKIDTVLAKLGKALEKGDIDAAVNLFQADCYWRDLVTFTWNLKTMEGHDEVRDMLRKQLAAIKPGAFRQDDKELASDGGGVTDGWFTFETEAARGYGHIRLKNGLIWTLLTTMTELKGHEEPKGLMRPMGAEHGHDPNRRTWLEKRQDEAAQLGYETQPYVVIIGGGQGGIALGARLRQLGVPTIIIEKHERAGDSWRKRYKSLCLHDPVWYDHLPYIPFPENWPVFAPKDKVGDWLEMYTKVMELNYWASTECVGARYDDTAKLWTVEVTRDSKPVTLRPAHIVFATGAYGPPKLIDLPGAADFTGEILHSSQYSDGERFKGQNVTVIGAASSGHDVSVDLWEAGAKVTMVQRSPTTVVRSQTQLDLAFGIYSEAALAQGITTEIADTIAASNPFALAPETQKPLTDAIRQRDAEFYEKLAASGFALDFGEDETGLMMKAYRTGSGYYVDVGASGLIISGDIAVKSGVAIERLTATSIRFADGEERPADVIICSTGFQSMHEVVATLVSRETADRIGPCWGLGSGTRNDPGPWQGELRNMYKPTAQEALWFHGGNLALSRYYSKVLALQIKVRMEGIFTPVYGGPPPKI